MADGLLGLVPICGMSSSQSWPLVLLPTDAFWPSVACHWYFCPSACLTNGTLAHLRQVSPAHVVSRDAFHLGQASCGRVLTWYRWPPGSGGHLGCVPPGTSPRWDAPSPGLLPAGSCRLDWSQVGRYASRSGLSGGTHATLAFLWSVLGGWAESLLSLERLQSSVFH